MDENENYTYFSNFCMSVLCFIFIGSNLIQWKGNTIEFRDQYYYLYNPGQITSLNFRFYL